jgi:two-component system LytT family sensor kinase
MPSLDLKKKYVFYSIHALAWLTYVVFATLYKSSSDPSLKVNVFDILFTYLPSVYVFYGNSIIFSRFLSSYKYVFLFVAEIVFFISLVLLYYIDGYLIGPLLNPGTAHPPFNLFTFTLQCSWQFFIYSYFSFGYGFALQSIRKEKQLQIIESKKLQAEKDRLLAEYSFLRSQINPHFLHNTLNFFYSRSLGISQELSEGILTLSEIMRYSLEDSDAGNGSVSLAREVDNLRKVIKINQLRFSNKLFVELTVSGNMDAFRIIPLILITIVENAFKHGELTNSQYPVVIEIETDEKERKLHFMTSNKKKTGPKELGYGIGMDNVKKRLEYAYQDNQRLSIREDRDCYTVEIDIHFKDERTIDGFRQALEKVS